MKSGLVYNDSHPELGIGIGFAHDLDRALNNSITKERSSGPIPVVDIDYEELSPLVANAARGYPKSKQHQDAGPVENCGCRRGKSSGPIPSQEIDWEELSPLVANAVRGRKRS